MPRIGFITSLGSNAGATNTSSIRDGRTPSANFADLWPIICSADRAVGRLSPSTPSLLTGIWPQLE
jgi:hypothetical protein